MLCCHTVRRWMRPCYPQHPRISQRTQSTQKCHKGNSKLSHWFCPGLSALINLNWLYHSGCNKEKFARGWWSEKLLRGVRTGTPVSSTHPKQCSVLFRKQPHISSVTVTDCSQQRRQTDTGSSLNTVWQVSPLSNKSSF